MVRQWISISRLNGVCFVCLGFLSQGRLFTKEKQSLKAKQRSKEAKVRRSEAEELRRETNLRERANVTGAYHMHLCHLLKQTEMLNMAIWFHWCEVILNSGLIYIYLMINDIENFHYIC